jgi:hypothetical protein
VEEKEMLIKILEEMAEVGFNACYEEKWGALSEDLMEKSVWKEISFNMLKAIKFPATVSKVTKYIYYNNIKFEDLEV